MNAFHVWLRPLGKSCRISVDGTENAEWLLGQLSKSTIFKTAEPFDESDGTSVCSFDVSYTPTLSRSKFEKLLATIPEVKLMLAPSSQSGTNVETEKLGSRQAQRNKPLNVHF